MPSFRQLISPQLKAKTNINSTTKGAEKGNKNIDKDSLVDGDEKN